MDVKKIQEKMITEHPLIRSTEHLNSKRSVNHILNTRHSRYCYESHSVDESECTFVSLQKLVDLFILKGTFTRCLFCSR